MPFLYHARPDDMRGDTLLPLNQLRRLHPDVYERAREKYAGREAVTAFRVPVLDVLWNDALHLSPIHPARLAAAWAVAGLPESAWEGEFFAIPVDRIDAGRAVWFAQEVYLTRDAPDLPAEDFSPFDPARYEELAELPAGYADYLRQRRESGRPLRRFAAVPHVLVTAPIDVAGLTLVRAV
jgi:hypothetical protein